MYEAFLKNADFCVLGNDSISYLQINLKCFLIPTCTNHPKSLIPLLLVL